MSEKSEKTSAAEQQAPADAVYAELPAPTASIGTDDAWHEAAMRDFADRTHAARLRCKSEQARLATLWGYVRADAGAPFVGPCRECNGTGAAPQQEAQEPATVPYQKLTNEIDQILSDPDTELSIGAKRALLWVRTWVSAPLWTTPQPAPAPLSDDVVKDAARYRWLRDVPMAEWPDELVTAFQLQQNTIWDAAIDAALAAQGGKV